MLSPTLHNNNIDNNNKLKKFGKKNVEYASLFFFF